MFLKGLKLWSWNSVLKFANCIVSYLHEYLKSWGKYAFSNIHIQLQLLINVFSIFSGARRDKDGYLWVTGRIDDMLNVSGHLMSTAEVESVLAEHTSVAEAAVVSKPHPVKGQCLYCFVTPNEGKTFDKKLQDELKKKGSYLDWSWKITFNKFKPIFMTKIFLQFVRKLDRSPSQM